jgi:hypothetical protein
VAQTHDDLRVLVVGDGCDERTGAVIEEIADSRVRYGNLSTRFGEQSGPNSVGMALADSPFLAIVNHDDLLLPDHLEHALDRLCRRRADLFVGRTAFTRDVTLDEDGLRAPAIHRFSRYRRRLSDVFPGPFNLFEPCSSWVFTRSLRDRVGPWRPASRLFRSPLEDWLLRAWRSRARAVFGRRTTVLKVSKRGKEGASGPLYGDPGARHLELARLVSSLPADEVRRRIDRDFRLRRERRPARRAAERSQRHTARARRRRPRWTWSRPFDPLFGSLYRATGVDVYSAYCVMRGRPRGWRLHRASLRRTGHPLPDPSDLGEMIEQYRRSLEGDAE